MLLTTSTRLAPCRLVSFLSQLLFARHPLSRVYQDTQIAEVTHLLSKAFTDYNLPIKAAAEVVADDFGDLLTASWTISGSVLPV